VPHPINAVSDGHCRCECICLCAHTHACICACMFNLRTPKPLLLWEFATLSYLNNKLSLTRQCAFDNIDVTSGVVYYVCDVYILFY
jgi:hypothetical protein